MSVSLEPLMPALPCMLRAAGAAWMAPAFTLMPLSLRLALGVASAWIAMPLAEGGAAPASPWWQWAPLELLAGICIGGVAAVSVEALRLAGRVASEQMGLTIGEHPDPSGEIEGGPVQAMMGWAAAIAFVSVGGIDAVVLAAAKSAGGEACLRSPDRVASLLDAAFEVGLRACLPVMAVAVAGTCIGGAVVRAAPRLVTLGGGFGVRAAAGMGMLAASVATAWAVQQELVRRSLGMIVPGGAW